MAANNVNVALIKSAMHHKDLKTTLNVYAHQEDAAPQAREAVHNQWFEAAGLIRAEGTAVGSRKERKKVGK